MRLCIADACVNHLEPIVMLPIVMRPTMQLATAMFCLVPIQNAQTLSGMHSTVSTQPVTYLNPGQCMLLHQTSLTPDVRTCAGCMQVGWGHVAALGLVGWLGWRLGQRMAAQAAERAQQALVESQLQQQALAEALAEQRAVSGEWRV